MEKRLESLRLLRIYDIIGDQKRGITPLIPIGRSSWLAGVKSGKYPSPVKIGRCIAWRFEDIFELMNQLAIGDLNG